MGQALAAEAKALAEVKAQNNAAKLQLVRARSCAPYSRRRNPFPPWFRPHCVLRSPPRARARARMALAPGRLKLQSTVGVSS